MYAEAVGTPANLSLLISVDAVNAGAGSGIGRCLAVSLARQGYKITVRLQY